MATQQFQITIPPGTAPGQMLTVSLPGGQAQIQVPAGCTPGSVIMIQNPFASATAAPAGVGQPSPDQLFRAVDADMSGSISVDELQVRA